MPAADGESAQSHPKPAPSKALRFVANYGTPYPKRRRIGAACLTCRKRKTACSGERPTCETCRQTKLECTGYSSDAAGTGHKRTASDASTAGAPERTQSTSSAAKKLKQKADIDPRLASPSASSLVASVQSPQTVRGVPGTNVANGAEPQEPLFAGPRSRMPYFRWLGPTAIVPGFKQMVVKVKRQDTADLARSSSDGGMLSPSLNKDNSQKLPSLYSATPAAVESDIRTPLNLPFYDTSLMPPSELITHLGQTFFTHLGCNYPFLQRERFLRDLEEKRVDAILVDAVCALAARFSTHSLLTQQSNDHSKNTPAEYGHAFAQRAKTALIDTYTCPSVAAVQAALLLGYNEFGESRDSGLWMYLGIAIRLAEDLGMHKLEGLRYKGKDGPTPKMMKRESLVGTSLISSHNFAINSKQAVDPDLESKTTQHEIEEQKAVEQERVDTFWALFFLDRVVSSGTGRRSTLRDKDIELSFPSLDETDPKTGWPAPFPALIRIVHLYGRVADLLNGIKEPSDITSDTPKRLAAMESQVTNFYQGLSTRLHFDALNFQHYVKAGEGTNFVLLHFWFHTLIVLLHQPTLLKTFEGRMLQLFPNSQQLSMSSAKTIADILSYSQLIDAKASLGSPFTTQPIYIAACAFLKETAEQTATSNAQSRASSPTRTEKGSNSDDTLQHAKKPSVSSSSNSKRPPATAADQKTLAKHTLLATAASQHYQLCHKALQSSETYWAGTKYILTVLDQKFQGVGDPLLYTVEEGESAMERPRPDPAFTSPGWRRKLSDSAYLVSPSNLWQAKGLGQAPGSPGMDLSKAIGWTLTGTMNSPSTNLAWHYTSGDGDNAQHETKLGSMVHPEFEVRNARMTTQDSSQPIQQQSTLHTTSASQPNPDQLNQPPLSSYPSSTSAISTQDASLLLGLNSPHQSSHTTLPHQYNQPLQPSLPNGSSAYGHSTGLWPSGDNDLPSNSMQNFGDMMIESQDVDMSMLGLDMMPWFDSWPAQDGFGMFDPGGGGNAGGGAEQRG